MGPPSSPFPLRCGKHGNTNKFMLRVLTNFLSENLFTVKNKSFNLKYNVDFQIGIFCPPCY